jgi:hypothetical protein
LGKALWGYLKAKEPAKHGQDLLVGASCLGPGITTSALERVLPVAWLKEGHKIFHRCELPLMHLSYLNLDVGYANFVQEQTADRSSGNGSGRLYLDLHEEVHISGHRKLRQQPRPGYRRS